MGINLSRTTNQIKGDITENKLPSTIPTPEIRKLKLDPRSPSSNVSRTPIEIMRTSVQRNSISSPCDVQTVRNGVDLDPRSPTVDFHRTPLVLNEEAKLQDCEIRNKNLDNARRSVISLTPMKSKGSTVVNKDLRCDLDNLSVESTSPRLLESNTKFVKHVESKRNSFVGLLETNIDFVETDIDTVIQQKGLSQSSQLEVSSEVEEFSNDVSITSNKENSNTKEDCHNLETNPIDEPLFEMNIDLTETVELPTTLTKCIELDRKLTNLIYEDIESDTKCKETQPAVANRLPLGDRDINNRQKPILTVNDKPTKLPKNISKIPVFKQKRIKGSNIQCENTPPRMLSNRSHWSTEDSLII